MHISTGNGSEMDGNLTYNPSTGTISATIFKGNIDAVDGDFDGTLEHLIYGNNSNYYCGRDKHN